MKKTYLLILVVLTFFGCRKERPVTPAGGNGIPINLTIDQSAPGAAISSNFTGLSFETQILTKNPEFLNVDNKVLIQLIKNLGPGILRIGGNTSDQIGWTGAVRDGTTGVDKLSTTDVDRLSVFSNTIGWPVIFGLNLGNNNVTTAVNEALYVHQSIGSNLYALQFGNEPDVYSKFSGYRSADYGYSNYQSEWETYHASVKSALPAANFAGPDIAYNTDWISAFASHESENVSLIDAHHYNSGPASDASITYKRILSPDFSLSNYLGGLKKQAALYHLPFRITECNNIYGGGKAGVSDVFASSLWALDLMWSVAQYNGQGVNFHCGTKLIYSPVIAENGELKARPEYYAMLAFKYGNNGGKMITANIDQSQYNCTAYASLNADNTYSITLINKDEVNAFSFNVQLIKKISSIQILRLSAPSVTSTSGVTFGGSIVNADGSFKPGVPEQSNVNQKNFLVNVPAGSAAVIMVK